VSDIHQENYMSFYQGFNHNTGSQAADLGIEFTINGIICLIQAIPLKQTGTCP